jgi:hypothetical protein
MISPFGIGPPATYPYPAQTTPWAASSQGIPVQGIPGGGTYPSGLSAYGVQQPNLQWLQLVPQQLQQLQQLVSIQQQQLQQVLQIVPAQLQQLQQLIQLVPQQLHQVLQFVAQQQFGGGAQGLVGATGQLSQSPGFGAPLQTLPAFSPFAVSSGHVM